MSDSIATLFNHSSSDKLKKQTSIWDAPMGKRLKLFIQAPARLHLGFIDLHGGMGRRYGGVGVALSEPRLQISMRSASRLLVRGANGKEPGA